MCLLDACNATVHSRLPAESGGVIAVDGQGNVATVFNSLGMFRASCNSNGEFMIGIWYAVLLACILLHSFQNVSQQFFIQGG